jgi:ATP adenylyltransferase
MSYGAPPMKSPLWAPWRMEYILGDKASGCFLCAMSALKNGELGQSHVLALLPDTLVCLNRYPFAAAHVLVAPRRHVGDIVDLSETEYASLMRVLREAAARVRRAVGSQGLNLGFNIGAPAGAGVADHVHGHVVPRWSGDTNFMPVLADVRVMPQYLDETYAHLAPYFADLEATVAP